MNVPVTRRRDGRPNVVPANTENVVPFDRARIEAVTALRLKLRDNGYKPVPITAPRRGDPSSGKKPLLPMRSMNFANASTKVMLRQEFSPTMLTQSTSCAKSETLARTWRLTSMSSSVSTPMRLKRSSI